jgi:hypothetical protein
MVGLLGSGVSEFDLFDSAVCKFSLFDGDFSHDVTNAVTAKHTGNRIRIGLMTSCFAFMLSPLSR